MPVSLALCDGDGGVHGLAVLHHMNVPIAFC